MKELEMFKSYLTTRGKSKNTLKAYFANIPEFLTISKVSTIEELKELKVVDFHTYLNVLRANGNSDSTRNAKLIAVKSFFRFLESIDVIDRNIAEKIDNSKIAKRDSVQPTREEASIILKSVKSRPKLFTMYTLLMNSGMRIDECLTLKLSDFRNNCLYVLGKGNKYRTIPLNQYAVETLQNYITKHRKLWTKEMLTERHNGDETLIEKALNDSELIFLGKNGLRMFNNNLNVSLDRTAEACGIDPEKCHPHAFRHYFATEFVRQGGKVQELQKILGHASILTTQIYFDVDMTTVQNTVNAMNF